MGSNAKPVFIEKLFEEVIDRYKDLQEMLGKDGAVTSEDGYYLEKLGISKTHAIDIAGENGTKLERSGYALEKIGIGKAYAVDIAQAQQSQAKRFDKRFLDPSGYATEKIGVGKAYAVDIAQAQQSQAKRFDKRFLDPSGYATKKIGIGKTFAVDIAQAQQPHDEHVKLYYTDLDMHRLEATYSDIIKMLALQHKAIEAVKGDRDVKLQDDDLDLHRLRATYSEGIKAVALQGKLMESVERDGDVKLQDDDLDLHRLRATYSEGIKAVALQSKLMDSEEAREYERQAMEEIRKVFSPWARWLTSGMEYLMGQWGMLKRMLGNDRAEALKDGRKWKIARVTEGIGIAKTYAADIAQAQQLKAKHIAKELENKDPMVRYRAAGALGKMGPAAKDAVPLLTKRLEYEVKKLKAKDKKPKDEFEEVWYDRAAVAWVLGKIGPAAQSAIELLDYMAKNDPIGYCRETAQRALRKIKGQ